MAKKKRTTRAAAAAAANKVVADGYKLDIHRKMDNLILTFDLVMQSGGQTYTLRVDTADTSTTLIQTMLRRIADLWPASDLTVQVDGGHIVG
jgi:hypothetical protein